MVDDISHVILRAKKMALRVHQSIFFPTKSGYNRPQCEHLQEVADLVWASGGSDAEIAAAWLHDSVEDTTTTMADIEKTFGKEIAQFVYGLTDADDIKDLPTLERKTIQADRVAQKSEQVRRIKLADQISNIRTVTLDPPHTWKHETNRDYAIGAKRIADKCRGVSPLLDSLFATEYDRACTYFNL